MSLTEKALFARIQKLTQENEQMKGLLDFLADVLQNVDKCVSANDIYMPCREDIKRAIIYIQPYLED